jgi:hypothetical protein
MILFSLDAGASGVFHLITVYGSLLDLGNFLDNILQVLYIICFIWQRFPELNFFHG